MSIHGSNRTTKQHLLEAAGWRVRLSELGAETTDEFDAWLAADARNAHAWKEVQQPWNLFEEQATSPELMDVRRRALGQARSVGQRRWREGFPQLGPRTFAIAACVVLCVVAGMIGFSLFQGDVYSTTTGERRTITLADASIVTLDARSKIRVRMNKTARNLFLLDGQARFEVAHDARRPFSVVAAHQKVIATGTIFNVNLLGPSVVVTLIEGHVTVVPDEEVRISAGAQDASRQSPGFNLSTSEKRAIDSAHSVATEKRVLDVELSAGERLVVSSGTASLAPVDTERSAAWQNGQIILEDEALSSVVVTMNRYASHPIKITDDSLSMLRISGVFNAGDVQGFLDTVTSYLPVTATEQNGMTLLSAR